MTENGTTRLGFDWPIPGHDLAELRVERTAVMEIRGGMTRVVTLYTPKAQIEIQVTRNGSARVFDRKRQGWPELKPTKRRPRLPYKAAHLRDRAEEADRSTEKFAESKQWEAVAGSLDLAAMLRCGADALEALG